MTTHGSAHLWDTEDKVKLKIAAKAKLFVNTVSFSMAVSHTVIIVNNTIHESYSKYTGDKTLDWGDPTECRMGEKVHLLGIVYEIKEGRTHYLDTTITCL
jgi:hypothetical protein